MKNKYPYIGKYPQHHESMQLIVFFTNPSEGYCLYCNRNEKTWMESHEGKFRNDWNEDIFENYENL